MSMQQALGAVGFVVGSYFGYPQLGFVVGSLVGGALTPAQKVEGPRIDDQKVAVSSYGVGIPQLFGTGRLAGVVVWSTDKIEVSTTESQGKGGGGVDTTTYKYYVHMRILLCERPADGRDVAIRKIWKDGKLVFDVSAGVSAGSAMASASAGFDQILYQGAEDQLPDPTMELFEGVGSVPAMRGFVTLQLNNVECPGGRVPQFSFEATNSFTNETASTLLHSRPFPTSYWAHGLCGQNFAYDIAEDGGFGSDRTLRVSRIEADSSTTLYIKRIDFNPEKDLGFIGVHGSADHALRSAWKGEGIAILERLQLDTGLITSLGDIRGENPLEHAYFDPLSGTYALVFRRTDKGAPLEVVTYGGSNGGERVTLRPDTAENVCIEGGTLFCLTNHDGVTWMARYDLASGNLIDEVAALVQYALTNGPYSSAVLNQIPMVVRNGETYAFASTVRTLWKIGAAWEEAASFAQYSSVDFQEFGGFFVEDEGAMLGTWDSGYRYLRFAAIETVETSVAEIIGHLCDRAGLATQQYDVSSIDDMVHGYTMTNPASARSNIQPLMTAYAIDATEEDSTIKFFHRSSKTSVVTIPYDDLGCADDGSEPGDPMPLTRAQEAELPRSINLSYLDPSFDYQTATEPSQRQITAATEDRSVDMPIATTADHAATVANWILYDAHAERNRRSCKISRQYAYLSAGDVITPEYPRGTFQARRIAKLTDTGALLELEVVDADPDLYLQQSKGAGDYPGQIVRPLPSPTRTVVMEGMPILRDADSDAGVYVAMQAMGSTGYRGSTLLVGDSDSSLDARGSVTRSATIGFSESGLIGPAVAFGFVDNTTQLVVNVGAGELHSATWEAMIVGGANVAALSVDYEVNGFPDALWEVFQFRTAEALGGGRYLLYGLLRGLRGTEQVAYHHQVGDQFVLLNNSGMLHVSLEAGGIGSTKFYRGVSLGRSPSSVPSVTAESTGYGLRPFSPVNVRRRSEEGSVVWTWNRRTRMQTNWQRGIVPLGEGSEAYEVVIYNDFFYTRIVRVIRAYAPTATYSAGELLADGYTASGPIPYRIYQLSATVGRGIPYQPNQGLI